MQPNVHPARSDRFLRWLLRNILPHALAIVVVLGLVHWLLPPFWGSPGLEYKVAHVEHADGRYERVFVGSSHLFRQVVPHILDSTLHDGSHSFVVALNAVNSPEAEIACEHILGSDHPPKDVFLELMPYTTFNEQSFANYRSWYFVGGQACATLVRHHFAQAGAATHERVLRVASDLRAFLYAGFLPGAKDRFAGEGGRMDTATVMGPGSDGHVPFEWQCAREPDNVNLRERQKAVRADTAEVGRRAKAIAREIAGQSNAKLSMVHQRHIIELMALADERGVRLRFILPPLWLVHEESAWALLMSLPADHRVDLCDPAKYPEFYHMANIFDAGHLNAAGAKLFTLRLAEHITAQTTPLHAQSISGAGCFASFVER